MIINGGEGWGREGKDSSAGQTESRKPFPGALSVSWSPREFFSFPLFRLLYNECSEAATFSFLYFSLEAGEGRTGSESNTWLLINCKLQLNSINSSNP